MLRRGFTKRTALTAFALVFTLVSVAMGAWVLVGVISGEATSKTGAPTAQVIKAAVTLSPSEGLLPEGSEVSKETTEANIDEAMFVEVPTQSVPYTITAARVTVTDSNESGCPVANFRIRGVSPAWAAQNIYGSGELKRETNGEVKAGKAFGPEEVANVHLIETAPIACASMSFHVKTELLHA